MVLLVKSFQTYQHFWRKVWKAFFSGIFPFCKKTILRNLSMRSSNKKKTFSPHPQKTPDSSGQCSSGRCTQTRKIWTSKGPEPRKRLGGNGHETWNPLSLWRLVWLVIACGVQRAIYAIGRGRELIEIYRDCIVRTEENKSERSYACRSLGQYIVISWLQKLIWFIRLFSEDLCKGTPGQLHRIKVSPCWQSASLLFPSVCCFLLEIWMILRTSHFWNNNRQQLMWQIVSAPQCWAKRSQKSPSFGKCFFWLAWYVGGWFTLLCSQFPFWGQKMYLHRVVIGI